VENRRVTEQAAIDDVIGRIALFEGRDVTVSPLTGGFSNGVFLVVADDERFAVRVPGEASDLLGIDRAAERHNAEVAAATGVGPRVLEYVDDMDVMVLEFIEGTIPTTEELQTPEQVRRIAASIGGLHEGPRFTNEFAQDGGSAERAVSQRSRPLQLHR
jgi:aminoglycoside phosphotransferase (APT) family kinase protein